MIRHGRSACPAHGAGFVRPTASSISSVVEGEACTCNRTSTCDYTSIHLASSAVKEGQRHRNSPTGYAVTIGNAVFSSVSCVFRYVANLYFKYFSCFRRMFQVFHLDVAYVAMAIHACFKHMFHTFSDYIISVSSWCCKSGSKCCIVAMAIHTCVKSMFQVFHLFSSVCCKWFI
jgi:hypothetical protein